MASSTQATFAFAYKRRYPLATVKDLTLSKTKFVDMVAKDESFSGTAMYFAMKYGNPQGFAGSRSAAQSNYSTVQGVQMALTTGTIADGFRVTHRNMVHSRDSMGAFLKAQLAESDGMYINNGVRMESLMFGNGGNSIGKIDADYTSGNDLTLVDSTDAVNFWKNQKLVGSTTDGSSAAAGLGGTPATVTAVNRSTGVITVDNAAAANLAADAYLFTNGSYGGDSTIDLGIKGLAAWIPSSDPSTSIYGVDRSIDPILLGGVRMTSGELAGKSIENKMKDACSKTARIADGSTDVIWTNPVNWRQLETELEAKGIRRIDETSKMGEARFGHKALVLSHPDGEAKVMASRYCPLNKVWGLQLDTWKLHSAGPLCQKLNEDGNEMTRLASEDDFEWRIVSYPALKCDAPGKNWYLSLA